MLASCSKDAAEGGVTAPDGSKSIVLKISVPQVTRAITPDDPYKSGTGATTISSLDVYFTNANGTIEAVFSLDNTDASDDYFDKITAEKGLRFVGLKNTTRVYCVANDPAEPLAANSNVTTQLSKKLDVQDPLGEQGQTIFVGYADDITPVILDTDKDVPTYENATAPQEGDQVFTADITIRPLISRIEWGKITLLQQGAVRVADNPNYVVVWNEWEPQLTGLFQSNVYLTSAIFGTTLVSDLFATPASSSDNIVNGAWKTGLYTGSPRLAHSGYTGSTPGALLPADYDGTTKCVPFHFFVPFDATSDRASNDVNGTEQLVNTPCWHFQLYYPVDLQNDFTHKVCAYKAELGEVTYENYKDEPAVSDDDALKLDVKLDYPVRQDGLAYANVVNLYQKSTTTPIVYQPGKIYTADVEIAPFNVSASFEEPDNFNVIVKVSVADFESKEVTPGFDQNL